MAESVKIVPHKDFEDFVSDLKKRPAIRLVKVADEGMVEPARQPNGAIVMQPRVRIVATAYDPSGEIVKWERKWDVGSGKVTLNATGGAGRHCDISAGRTKQEIIDELEVEQYQVVPGEWTLESVREILKRRRA